MFRLSPSRLYTTIGSQQRFSINNQSGAERLDTNRRTSLSRYPRQQARGQNLSDRYLKLEKSLREREALLLSKELDRYSHTGNSESIPAVNTQSIPRSIKSSSKPVQLFRGLEIPEEPKPPADDGAFFFFSTHLDSLIHLF